MVFFVKARNSSLCNTVMAHTVNQEIFVLKVFREKKFHMKKIVVMEGFEVSSTCIRCSRKYSVCLIIMPVTADKNILTTKLSRFMVLRLYLAKVHMHFQ